MTRCQSLARVHLWVKTNVERASRVDIGSTSCAATQFLFVVTVWIIDEGLRRWTFTYEPSINLSNSWIIAKCEWAEWAVDHTLKTFWSLLTTIMTWFRKIFCIPNFFLIPLITIKLIALIQKLRTSRISSSLKTTPLMPAFWNVSWNTCNESVAVECRSSWVCHPFSRLILIWLPCYGGSSDHRRLGDRMLSEIELYVIAI